MQKRNSRIPERRSTHICTRTTASRPGQRFELIWRSGWFTILNTVYEPRRVITAGFGRAAKPFGTLKAMGTHGGVHHGYSRSSRGGESAAPGASAGAGGAGRVHPTINLRSGK